MSKDTAPTEETTKAEEVNNEAQLSEEVSALKKDIDTLGDQLDNEEISLEEFQAKSNDALLKHTFGDFMNYYNAGYERYELFTNTSEEDLVKNKRVFITSNGTSSKKKRSAYNRSIIQAKNLIRAAKLVIGGFNLEELIQVYVERKLWLKRNDEYAIEEASKKIKPLLEEGSSLETFKFAKYANENIIDTIDKHLILALAEMVRIHGSYDGQNIVHSVAKNCNVVAIVLEAVKKMGVEEVRKADLSKYEIFSEAIKRFDAVIVSNIKA